MGNSGWTVDSDTITIPASAGPNDPRIVITGTPPPSGYPLDAAILFYWNGTDFWYIGITSFNGQDGYLVTGFNSVTTGDNDHIEEISYANNQRKTAIQQYIADYVNTSNYTPWNLGSTGASLQPTGNIALEAQGDTTVRQRGVDISIPRGSVDLDATAATGGITTVETVVGTLVGVGSSPSFGSNRRYRIEFMGKISSTVAGDRATVRIRQQTAAGTIEADCGEVSMPVAGNAVPVNVWCLYTGRQIVGEQVVLTVVRSAGTGTITYTPIEGLASDQAPTTLI